MLESRKLFLNSIDQNAAECANSLTLNIPVTERIISTIIELYIAAKLERQYTDSYFETAYHNPISGELEFYVSRILYHYSLKKELKWKIYLRKQQGKTAPDIRIQKNGITIGIVEIKAKAGWIQSVFSPDRYESDLNKFKNGHPFNPEDSIIRFRNQIEKYQNEYNVSPQGVFIFLPTLMLVHRKRYIRTLEEYQDYFVKTSGLSKVNWILLSKNMSLDLSNPKSEALLPTNNFEEFVYYLCKF